ncbi:MAG: site-specific integrase [Lachnospiraceae bacterium]|nr:site-specific integrase [Lachnospiraceae bacterium]
MASGTRRDSQGRVLQKGEYVRSSDGRIVYNYTDPLGRRRFLYDTDLIRLREREKEIKRDQLDGLDVYVRGRATLNTTYDRYISTKCNLRGSTMNGYTYSYEHYVRDTFGQKKLADIKYSDVLHFYLYLLNEKKLAIGTLDSIHCVLHPTFQLAVRDDIIRNNPSDGVMAEISKSSGKNRGIRHALSVDEQKAFMTYVSNHPVYCQWWSLFVILLGTGTRIGECLGLTWDDVDFEKGLISINHSIAYYKDQETQVTGLWIHKPKTEAGIRYIPMLDIVRYALDMIKEEQEEHCITQPVLHGMTGFLHLNRYGDVMNPQSVNRAIKRIIASYNNEEELNAAREKRTPLLLPDFSCHHLRHTFATRLCNACSNYKVIQYIMGHRSVETTMDIYAEATDEKNKEVFELLSDKLEGMF